MAKRVYTQTFAVVGAMIEKDGKFLLVKEKGLKGSKHPDIGKWNHPAGWLDVGENPIDGAKREAEEETGFQFIPTHILGVYSLVRRDILKINGDIHHPIKIIFLGKISDAREKELADDISETKWFTPEEIENMDSKNLRDPDIKTMVKDYLFGKKYPLDLITHTISK